MSEGVMSIGALFAIFGAYMAQGEWAALAAFGFVLVLLGLGGWVQEHIP
jgi:uncharacterized membrane protein